MTADPITYNRVGGRDIPKAVERVNKLISAYTMPFYLAFLEYHKLRSFVREFIGYEKDILIKRTILRKA